MPVSGSTRNSTTVPDAWFAASRKAPVGSSAKLRGVLPLVGTWPLAVSLPVAASTSNTAMLS